MIYSWKWFLKVALKNKLQKFLVRRFMGQAVNEEPNICHLLSEDPF